MQINRAVFQSDLQQDWIPAALFQAQLLPQMFIDLQQKQYVANLAFNALELQQTVFIERLLSILGSDAVFPIHFPYAHLDADYSLEIHVVSENVFWIALHLVSDIVSLKPPDQSSYAIEKQKNLVEMLPGFIYEFILDLTDQSQYLSYVSPGCMELIGYSADCLEKNYTEIIRHVFAEDLDAFAQSVQESAQSLKLWEFVFRYQHPHKGLRYLLARSRPLRFDNKIIWSGVVLDQTEHEEMALQRQEKEVHLSALLRAIPDIIFRVHRDGTIIVPGEKRTLWLSDFFESELKQCVPERFLRELHRQIETAIDCDILQSLEFKLDTPRTFYEARIAKSGSDDAICILRNTSDLKRTQELLSEHRQNLLAMIEHSPDNIWFVNHEMELIIANKPCHDNSEIFYGRRIKTGENVIDFMASKDPERAKVWTRYYTQALQGHPITIETEEHFHGKKFYVENAFKPVFDEAEVRGCLVISRDITAHKEIQATLQNMNEKLEQSVQERTAEYLQAKEQAEAASQANEQFSANMSHEIRTPINAVLGYATLLEEHIQNPHQLKYLQGIKFSARNLLVLINDVLDLSKIKSGKMELQPEPMELIPLLKEMQQIFEMQLNEKDILFKLKYPQDMPGKFYLDEVRLRQVLFNLLGNAVKFTERGEVVLAVNYASVGPSEVELELKIMDTGIGIQPTSLDSIFEAFVQQVGQRITKYGGTGLGLNITKRLVSLMDGQIDVQTQPGQGSCFTVTFSARTLPDTVFSNPCSPSSRYCPMMHSLVIGSPDFIEHLQPRFAANGTQVKTSEQISDLGSFKPHWILLELPLNDESPEVTLSNLRAIYPEVQVTLFCYQKPSEYILQTYKIHRWLRPDVDCEKICQTWEQGFGQSLALIERPNELQYVDQTQWEKLLIDWQDAVESHSFNVISEFSRKLMLWAEKANNILLLDFAQDLSLAVTNFDVIEMEDLLSQFPGLIHMKEPER